MTAVALGGEFLERCREFDRVLDPDCLDELVR